jgi:ABC-type transport system involved in Fe-S cluster assembly fused permease/ATPase subunit
MWTKVQSVLMGLTYKIWIYSRGLMGLVTQDSIFNDTIKANISLGKPDATDDEIIVVLKKLPPMNS